MKFQAAGKLGIDEMFYKVLGKFLKVVFITTDLDSPVRVLCYCCLVGMSNPMERRKFHELTFYQRVWVVKSLCDWCLVRLVADFNTMQRCFKH